MSRAIMVQGTASNVGKSLLVAALCRIFKQDGHAPAPFKSQNMALNSFVTAQGLEMGRAQVVQAQAAGIEPSVLMNPVLLKPCSDTGSQVIVCGEVLGDMPARDYFAFKHKLVPQIMQAYNTLAKAHNILVLEGAGSPAEINLKADDIVNMGMARRAGAPVLLVGDIDRGGVFASLAGTLMLLDPDERAMVKGLIINKFRGDVRILEPGLRQIEEITGVPVLGVIPYMRVELEDEDSLSEQLSGGRTQALLDIAVIRLPRISNFTDFGPLAAQPEAGVRYVDAASRLGKPDLVIIPGTKSTMEDLRWLRESGLEAAILKFAAAGGAVLGICGGYQMLGETLSDPQRGFMRGMGLLPVHTQFTPQKVRTQAAGHIEKIAGTLSALSGVPVHGYEIHMGITTGADTPFMLLETVNGASAAQPDGAVRGNIYGTYLHGLFDSGEATAALIDGLCAARGISRESAEVFDFAQHREQQFNLLADTVRANLDMERIYAILEAGI